MINHITDCQWRSSSKIRAENRPLEWRKLLALTKEALEDGKSQMCVAEYEFPL